MTLRKVLRHLPVLRRDGVPPPSVRIHGRERAISSPCSSPNRSISCLTCFACVDRCPRGVEPANARRGRPSRCRSASKGGNHLHPGSISPELLDEDIPAAGTCQRYAQICKVIWFSEAVRLRQLRKRNWFKYAEESAYSFVTAAPISPCTVDVQQVAEVL